MAAPLSPSMAKFRNAAHRATAFTPRKEKQKKEDDILPVQVSRSASNGLGFNRYVV